MVSAWINVRLWLEGTACPLGGCTFLVKVADEAQHSRCIYFSLNTSGYALNVLLRDSLDVPGVIVMLLTMPHTQ